MKINLNQLAQLRNEENPYKYRKNIGMLDNV